MGNDSVLDYIYFTETREKKNPNVKEIQSYHQYVIYIYTEKNRSTEKICSAIYNGAET